MIISCYIIEKEKRYDNGAFENELIYLDTCLLKEGMKKFVREILKEQKGSNRNYDEYTNYKNQDIIIDQFNESDIIDRFMYDYMNQKNNGKIIKHLPSVKISRYHNENSQRNTYITLSLKLREYRYDTKYIKDKVNVMVRDSKNKEIISQTFIKTENEFIELIEKYKKTSTYLLIDFYYEIDMYNIEKIELIFNENDIRLKAMSRFSNGTQLKEYLLYKKDCFNRSSELIKNSITNY